MFPAWIFLPLALSCRNAIIDKALPIISLRNCENIYCFDAEKVNGATKINAGGTYSNTEKSVLICVVNKHQLNDFQLIISKYGETFAFYELINETYGNFKYIRQKRSR